MHNAVISGYIFIAGNNKPLFLNNGFFVPKKSAPVSSCKFIIYQWLILRIIQRVVRYQAL